VKKESTKINYVNVSKLLQPPSILKITGKPDSNLKHYKLQHDFAIQFSSI